MASIVFSGMFESLLIGAGQCLSGGQADPAEFLAMNDSSANDTLGVLSFSPLFQHL